MEKDHGFIEKGPIWNAPHMPTEICSVTGEAENVRVILPAELPTPVKAIEVRNNSAKPITVETGAGDHLLVIGDGAEFAPHAADPDVPHIVNRAMAEASLRVTWKRIS